MDRKTQEQRIEAAVRSIDRQWKQKEGEYVRSVEGERRGVRGEAEKRAKKKGYNIADRLYQRKKIRGRETRVRREEKERWKESSEQWWTKQASSRSNEEEKREKRLDRESNKVRVRDKKTRGFKKFWKEKGSKKTEKRKSVWEKHERADVKWWDPRRCERERTVSKDESRGRVELKSKLFLDAAIT